MGFAPRKRTAYLYVLSEILRVELRVLVGRNSQSSHNLFLSEAGQQGEKDRAPRATAVNSSYPLTSSEDRDILGGEAKMGFRGDAGRVPKPRAEENIRIL